MINTKGAPGTVAAAPGHAQLEVQRKEVIHPLAELQDGGGVAKGHLLPGRVAALAAALPLEALHGGGYGTGKGRDEVIVSTGGRLHGVGQSGWWILQGAGEQSLQAQTQAQTA